MKNIYSYQTGGFEPIILSGATYLGHVLVSLIHHNQITGHDILDIYDKVDNNLARGEIENALENEVRYQSVVNAKEIAQKYKAQIKDELKKIKKDKEISSIKKDLKEPLTQLLKNKELEEKLLDHNYKKKVVLTDEEADLYAKSIFSERLLDKISLNIDEVIEVVQNVKKEELNEDQKDILKIVQNFVYLYKYFKDKRSHFEYDEDGKRVFIVEGKLKTKSLSAATSNKGRAVTAKHRFFRFKTPKRKPNIYRRVKTIRKAKSSSIEKKQTKQTTNSNNITSVASAS